MNKDEFIKQTGWDEYDTLNSWGGFFHEAKLNLDDVAAVLHSSEGDNDYLDWLLVGRHTDGRFFFALAGCDYTGWDCQAWGMVDYYDTYEEVFDLLNMTDEHRSRLKESYRE